MRGHGSRAVSSPAAPSTLSSPHGNDIDGKRRQVNRPGPAAALFRSLGDATRLTILRNVAGGEARVVDLTARVGLEQATVSKHLACLRDCGLVQVRVEGRASVYSLAQPGLMDVLSAAETVLAATGNAVALCPVYGKETRG